MSFFKKVKDILKKHWILIWLFAAAFSLGAILVYAKFADSQNVLKRVIMAGSSDKELFSSNFLKNNDPFPKYPKNVRSEVTTDSSFDISVYNFDRTKTAAYYHDTIRYTLTASLYKDNGTVAYTTSEADRELLDEIMGDDSIRVVQVTMVNGVEVETPIITLGKNVPTSAQIMNLPPDEVEGRNTHKFRLKLPASVKDKNVYVKITAEPDSAHSDLPRIIGGFFYLKTNTIVLTSGWEGDFNDNTLVRPAGYDAFNYAITGNGDELKVLSWDKSLLEPNKQEILDLFGIDMNNSSSYTDSGNIRSINVSLSSATNGGRYDIQFYVVDSTARSTINGMEWSGLKTKVTLTDP